MKLIQQTNKRLIVNSDECDYGVVEIIRNDDGSFTMRDTYCEVYQNTYTKDEFIEICDEIKEWANGA